MFMTPVSGPITSKYGWRVVRFRPNFHNGLDWGWLKADPVASRRVYAPASGKIATGWNDLVGNYVEIPTSVGTLRLCHFASLSVKTGATVRRGQLLGVMGETGSQAVGVHLHVDLFVGGGRVDPQPYFTIPLQPALTGPDGQPINEQDDDMPLPLFYVAQSDSPSKIVKKGQTWVRAEPGQPLKRLTDGQATDWRTALGIIDFTSPNLIGKDGAWFDAAFAEDKLVHEVNAQAHPWLVSSGGASAEQIASAVNQALSDEFNAVNENVNKPRTLQ